MLPLFSIVIANRNYGRFLEDAIQSVLVQGMGDQVELIICDAASTDNSVEIIKKYAAGLPPNVERHAWKGMAHPLGSHGAFEIGLPVAIRAAGERNERISFDNSRFPTPDSQLISWWCSEPDGGQSAAFNKGFSHARGRFLTWLNSDDILTSGALRSIANVIARYPNDKWFVGSCVWTDYELRIQHCFCAHRFSILRASSGILSVGGPSSFFTKGLLDKAGGFDESLHYKMDTDLWYRFYRKCGAKYQRSRHNVFAYRQHEASKMSGADSYATMRALANRRRSLAESKILAQRYGKKGKWLVRIIRILTWSCIDYLYACYRESLWHGRRAYEI